LLCTAKFSNAFFILTSNGATHALTIPTSGSAHYWQGKGKFPEFHLKEVRDISAKAVDQKIESSLKWRYAATIRSPWR